MNRKEDYHLLFILILNINNRILFKKYIFLLFKGDSINNEKVCNNEKNNIITHITFCYKYSIRKRNLSAVISSGFS